MRADVAVIGLGHAGIEAALAAARLGRHVVAVVPDLRRIGVMSCNPAIGGSGKSQLVRELDALGGAMARVADASGIHFRRLNASRGAAVHATRVLCDRAAYAATMQRRVLEQPGLEVVADSAVGLVREQGAVVGVRLQAGGELRAAAVVLTTGTFLSAVLHTGETTTEGGRVGEEPARGISNDLRALGLRLTRFKTGTPPRLWARSIDIGRTEHQPGDEPPRALSFWTDPTGFPRLPQRPCWMTYTNANTHEVVRSGLHRSPLFQGRIAGRGPRYCPSLEDKVVRFAERARHPVFLEPEGIDAPWVYPAGLSTSLPPELQVAFLRTIAGLEEVEIAQPGYAVEYDCVPATQLNRRLAVGETGLFLAGQINGTSGYEEAAVQGLWAGVNAARFAVGQGAWSLPRESAYIAVLVEELLAKDGGEPFRMFTSRSEARLSLREGNADLRLAAAGLDAGLLPSELHGMVEARRLRISTELERLRRIRLSPDRSTRERLVSLGIGDLEQPATPGELLARPHVRWSQVAGLSDGAPALDAADAEEVEAEVKYAGYLRREGAKQARVSQQLGWSIPPQLDYAGLAGLSREARERLQAARPETLGAAANVPGVTAAALAILAIHLTRHRGGPSCG